VSHENLYWGHCNFRLLLMTCILLLKVLIIYFLLMTQFSNYKVSSRLFITSVGPWLHMWVVHILMLIKLELFILLWKWELLLLWNEFLTAVKMSMLVISIVTLPWICRYILLHAIVRFPWRHDIGDLSSSNVNTLVAISLMTLAAVHHYCICDSGHRERRFLWLRDCCLQTSVDFWS
jgi:hypothetical protein